MHIVHQKDFPAVIGHVCTQSPSTFVCKFAITSSSVKLLWSKLGVLIRPLVILINNSQLTGHL